ncbi:MAG: hypothetical protein EOM80_10665 [Erysipelotrichia bacterium]|nr:hypothetical protein [Candidatus Riflebacteria bacterium]NCB39223.1 hypothetical protein [Erysipelotrichia bacterium]
MKKEHLDIVWESCSEFERSNISFNEFLEKLGKAMESASTPEARTIGALARNLEHAVSSGSFGEIQLLLKDMKYRVATEISRSKD